MSNKNNKNKKQGSTSKALIVLICIMIILYTAADFVLQAYAQIEVSPTLTQSWFTFWGAELVVLAGIKISKVVKGEDKNKEDQLPVDDTDNNEV